MAADELSFHELLNELAARHDKVVVENQQLRGNCEKSCSCKHSAGIAGRSVQRFQSENSIVRVPSPRKLEIWSPRSLDNVVGPTQLGTPQAALMVQSLNSQCSTLLLRDAGCADVEFPGTATTLYPNVQPDSASVSATSSETTCKANRNIDLGVQNRTDSKASVLEPSMASTRSCIVKMSSRPAELWPIWEQKSADPSRTMVPIRLDTSFQTRRDHSARGTSCLQPFIMHPSSKKRLLWDFLSVVVLTFDIITVPLFAFELQVSPILTTCITVFWSLDIVASFISGYYNLGFLEMRPSKIARRYVRGSFVLDLFIVVMEIVMLVLTSDVFDVVGVARLGKMARLSRIFRFTRLIRVIKIPGLTTRIADYVQSEMLSTAISIGKTLVLIALVCHYIACAWFTIGGWRERRTWISELHRQDVGYSYLTALHWSLTQFMPASMEVHPTNAYERMFAIVVIMAAMCVFSSFVSSMTAAMTNLQNQRQQRLKQTGNIQRYMTENRISMGLGAHIMAFLRAYDFNARQRLHENDLPVFQVLPETLRVQLHWEIYHPVLVVHPLFYHFNEVSQRGLMDICHTAMGEKSLILTEELFTPGQEATTMYFIVTGVLGYYDGWSDADPFEVSSEKWFCEVVLWIKWEHCGRIVAMTPCELMALDAAVFRKHIARQPPLHKACREYAKLFKESVAEANHTEPADIWCDIDKTQDMVHTAFRGIYVTAVGRLARMRRSKTRVELLQNLKSSLS